MHELTHQSRYIPLAFLFVLHQPKAALVITQAVTIANISADSFSAAGILSGLVAGSPADYGFVTVDMLGANVSTAFNLAGASAAALGALEAGVAGRLGGLQGVTVSAAATTAMGGGRWRGLLQQTNSSRVALAGARGLRHPPHAAECLCPPHHHAAAWLSDVPLAACLAVSFPKEKKTEDLLPVALLSVLIHPC